ncbi:hypothetical protein RWV98_05720 [Agathobaculum sp. NTUH-O15-33]|uniref:hypothetical protein n=1 Tax=Agathobaculum sp. NTUH-O15-33 TaxID=3079302 RepID=UPI0029583EE1|nr:hypothetical protein [Agathobaculum sp. NTUH-O15-33]WNX85765.1 hypothetical protein RWV98_05720 [Agathobaculum sp. NTUH-O15-33]
MNYLQVDIALAQWLREQKIGGLDEAAFISELRRWIEKNAANGRHEHDGRYWTYNSIRALCRMYPCWTKRQVERIIGKLRDAGLIMTANYSKDPSNTTLYYSVAEEKIPVSPFGGTLSPNGDTPSPHGDDKPSPNGDDLSPNGETLKEQNKTIVIAAANKQDKQPSPRWVMEQYNTICTKLNPCIRMTDKRAKAVRVLLGKGYAADQLVSAFHLAQASNLCTGGGSRGWKADFDWLTKEDNLVKVLEGKYTDHSSQKPEEPQVYLKEDEYPWLQ